MKRYLRIILSVLLVLLLVFNIFIAIKNSSDISKRTSNTITEILRCIEDTKECLQDLIDNEDPSYQGNMMYVINGKFSTLYHLCHANRYIYSSACSDFEHIGATFIGPASNPNFTTSGIYDDFKITDNEREYMEKLIILLDELQKNVAVSNVKYDLDILNSNLKKLEQQLHDLDNSPYLLISVNNPVYCFQKNSLLGDIGAKTIYDIYETKIIDSEYGEFVLQKEDIFLLENYKFLKDYPSDKLHELIVFPRNKIINISVDDKVFALYLMEDGNIGVRISEEEGFKLYQADEKSQITSDKYDELINKYNIYK